MLGEAFAAERPATPLATPIAGGGVALGAHREGDERGVAHATVLRAAEAVVGAAGPGADALQLARGPSRGQRRGRKIRSEEVEGRPENRPNSASQTTSGAERCEIRHGDLKSEVRRLSNKAWPKRLPTLTFVTF